MGFIEVSVITFVGILIFCIISIVISNRNYKRLVESQMEDIKRGPVGWMRDWTEEDYRQYEYVSAIHRSRENLITEEEKKIEPTKHIKRHSIR